MSDPRGAQEAQVNGFGFLRSTTGIWSYVSSVIRRRAVYRLCVGITVQHRDDRPEWSPDREAPVGAHEREPQVVENEKMPVESIPV